LNYEIFLTLVALAFVCDLNAQLLRDPSDPPHSQHVHTPTTPVIDGATNPELIPDGTAYRLVFVTAADSANPGPHELARHSAYLGKVGMNEGDRQLFADTLKVFKGQYDDLIKNYNDAAQVAIVDGQAPDIDAFLRRREALVQSTRDKLKLVLTNEGVASLDAFVKAEKRSMKTQPPAQ
jgi:hypothetical protein